MAEQTVLREFLVSLGFSLDNTSLGKFTTGIEQATAGVVRFGETIAGIAAASAYALDKFSQDLEGLYFSAMRVGSSASALRAFEQASRNFGASAGEAQSAAEGLAEALNTNPGNMGLLSGLLGRVGANVSADNIQNLQNLSKVFQSMPLWMANQYAGQLGISYNELFAMTRRGFNAEAMRQKPLNAGITGAASTAHQIQKQWRDIQTSLTVDFGHLSEQLWKSISPVLTRFEHWLSGPEPKKLGDAFASLFDTALKKVTAIFDEIQKIRHEIETPDKNGLGWADKTALGLLAANKIAPGLTGGVVGGLLGLGTRAITKAPGAVAAAEGATGGLGAFALGLPALGAFMLAMAAIPKWWANFKAMQNGTYGPSDDKAWQNYIFKDAPWYEGGPGGPSWLKNWHWPSFHSLVGAAPRTKYDNPAAPSTGTVINDNRVAATINIDGSRSPTDTANATVDALKRIQRNSASAVR